MVDGKAGSFEKLEIWQDAIELASYVYKLTRKFPDSEKFAITDQIRRAAASVSANIAEGYGRTSRNDKLHFYAIAYGSLLETKSFLYLSRKLEYIEQEELTVIIDGIEVLQKKINAFSNYVRSKDV